MAHTDGLIDYTLGRDYGEDKAGTVIRVDPARKLWLDKNGYGHEHSDIPAVTEARPAPLYRRRHPAIDELEPPPTIDDMTIREG